VIIAVFYSADLSLNALLTGAIALVLAVTLLSAIIAPGLLQLSLPGAVKADNHL
jgi:Na+/H+ antiporter NhaA